MSNAQRIGVSSRQREELLDITHDVAAAIRASGVTDGIAFLWSLHTTCALTVNEGADPDVARDLVAALRRLAPRAGDYHHAEGNSDAHVKVSLFGPGLTLLVEDGAPLLGTWQRVFLAEWDGPRARRIALRVIPAPGT
jgi:secondary thiamine-phosphate synthase enzyme